MYSIRLWPSQPHSTGKSLLPERLRSIALTGKVVELYILFDSAEQESTKI